MTKNIGSTILKLTDSRGVECFMINEQIKEARENFSSDSSVSTYTTELIELTKEAEEDIIPKINKDIYPNGCEYKLIELGKLYFNECEDKEEALRQYFKYYLIARYVYIRRYEESLKDEDKETMYKLDVEFDKIKEEYTKAQNKTLTYYEKAIKEFVEKEKPAISISSDKKTYTVTLKVDKSKLGKDGYAVFFFIGIGLTMRIKGIVLQTEIKPELSNGFKGRQIGSRVEKVAIEKDSIVFFIYKNDKEINRLKVSKTELDITILDKIFDKNISNSGLPRFVSSCK